MIVDFDYDVTYVQRRLVRDITKGTRAFVEARRLNSSLGADGYSCVKVKQTSNSQMCLRTFLLWELIRVNTDNLSVF